MALEKTEAFNATLNVIGLLHRMPGRLQVVRCILMASVFVSSPALAFLTDPGASVPAPTRYIGLSAPGAAREEMVSRIIVKPRQSPLKNALLLHDAGTLAKITNMPMKVIRAMSGGAHVIGLDHPVTLSEARNIAASLVQDGTVEFAEPDRLMHPMAEVPTDPYYAQQQWNLFTPSSANMGSANLPNAWSMTKGSKSVTIAVLDTGYQPHADFGVLGTTILSSGYTFISDAQMANNGYGRGPDALDTGDWITGTENTTVGGKFYGCGKSDDMGLVNQLQPSSWHGMHVSGIIAAQMNGIGITGVSPQVQILPVRVLGKCGGYDSDIIDGMRWAAGLAVSGVPNNPHPAQILSMSLGASGFVPCSSAYQTAIDEIIRAGKLIVVAAGNDGSPTLSTPANCTGVVSVTATSINGDKAWYSTTGSTATISAPGGGCAGTSPDCNSASYPGIYSLVNSGTTTPVQSPAGDSYASYSGTSMATPHVSAVAALMLSLNPALTPTQIKSYLQSSARPYPSGTTCAQSTYSGRCGTGLLDAYNTLKVITASSLAPQTIGPITLTPSVLTVGNTSRLSATASSGLPVTFTSGSEGVCTVVGTTVTAIRAGVCVIAASQIGNQNYLTAPMITNSFSIGPLQIPALFVNASTSANKTSILGLINTTSTLGWLNATAYSESGDVLGNANTSLGPIHANEGLIFTSAEIEATLAFTPALPTSKYSVVISSGLDDFQLINYTKDNATGALTLAQSLTKDRSSSAASIVTRSAWFLSASTSTNKTNVLRIINPSSQAGTLQATAYDEAGSVIGKAGSLLGSISPHQMLSYTSEQLENALGFVPSAPTSKYRVVFTANLSGLELVNFTKDIATGNLALVQSQLDDRPVSAATSSVRNLLSVEASSNPGRVTMARFVNPNPATATLTAIAYNEAGAKVGQGALGTVPANGILALQSSQIEASLGYTPTSSEAVYHLVVTANVPTFEVLNNIRTPNGNLYLAQLQTDSVAVGSGSNSTRNAYVLYASSSVTNTSLLRLVNTTSATGAVTGTAYDSSGNLIRSNVPLGTLKANQMLTFTSAQLESLFGYAPPRTTSKWRIAITANVPDFALINLAKDVRTGLPVLAQPQQ